MVKSISCMTSWDETVLQGNCVKGYDYTWTIKFCILS